MPMRTRLFTACALFVAVASLVRVGHVVDAQLDAPFDLAYETPLAAAALEFAAGRHPYDEARYGGAPFVLCMYTPLYLQAVGALHALLDDVFLAGRVIALGALALVVAAFFALRPRAGWWVPVLGAGLLLLHWPVAGNAVLVKNDTLAIACSAWALLAVAGPARERSAGLWRCALAAVLCLAAVATKQSTVAGIAACGLALLACGVRTRRWGPVLAFAGVFATGVALLAWLASWAYGSSFWFCTLVAPRNPFAWGQAARVLAAGYRQPLLWGTSALLALLAFGALIRRRPFACPFLLYAVFAWGVFALTVPKLGSWTTYFIEPVAASLLALAAAAGRSSNEQLTRTWRGAAALLLVVLACVDLFIAVPTDYAVTDALRRPRRQAVDDEMRADIVAMAGDEARVLNLWTPIHTYSIQQHSYVNDTLLYRILWNEGVLAVEPMLELLREQHFDVVLMPRGLTRDTPLLDEHGELARPLTTIVQAAFDAYTPHAQDGQYQYLLR